MKRKKQLIIDIAKVTIQFTILLSVFKVIPGTEANQCDGEIPAELSGLSGIIQHPISLQDNCTWIIKVPDDRRIKLTFSMVCLVFIYFYLLQRP
jgi:hypothetical protein